MKFITLLVLSLSTLLFACSSDPAQTAEAPMQMIKLQDLQKEWQLVSIDDKPIESKSKLSIDEKGQAVGNLACNNFFGPLTLEENKIRIEPMGSTLMMCEPAVNEVEMMVSRTLTTWSEVQLSTQGLILVGEKHTLVYSMKE